MGEDAVGGGVRAARPGDADERLRLRVAVLDGAPLDERWRAAFRDDLRARPGRDLHLRALVAPPGGGRGPAACAIGSIHHGYRGPSRPTGRWGRIHTVVRDPAHPRRGPGRAVTAASVEALAAAGCGPAGLRATGDGAALRRGLGFGAVDGYARLDLGGGR
ncbi:hypothetical protein [Kitasatospora sp. NPDC059462]|uniref:hypothetical protein n=1 Tax=Kitasatospora sp. NPDC059462 TaxID=3346841 RepID=UPI0036A2C57A